MVSKIMLWFFFGGGVMSLVSETRPELHLFWDTRLVIYDDWSSNTKPLNTKTSNGEVSRWAMKKTVVKEVILPFLL